MEELTSVFEMVFWYFHSAVVTSLPAVGSSLPDHGLTGFPPLQHKQYGCSLVAMAMGPS